MHFLQRFSKLFLYNFFFSFIQKCLKIMHKCYIYKLNIIKMFKNFLAEINKASKISLSYVIDPHVLSYREISMRRTNIAQ